VKHRGELLWAAIAFVLGAGSATAILHFAREDARAPRGHAIAIEIRTYPIGAEVHADGVLLGNAPQHVRVRAGERRRVRIVHPLCDPRELSIDHSTDRSVLLLLHCQAGTAIRREPTIVEAPRAPSVDRVPVPMPHEEEVLDGVVVVRSEPPGAEVWSIDGVLLGNTPFSVMRPERGEERDLVLRTQGMPEQRLKVTHLTRDGVTIRFAAPRR
jgi:hypothetical protein